MGLIWAEDFFDILPVLAKRRDLLNDVEHMIMNEKMPGKCLEGRGRAYRFRPVLLDLVNGRITLDEAYIKAEAQLQQVNSPYLGDPNVFVKDWAERIVRVNLSRFYNQAVLLQLLAEGQERCLVPHSKHNDVSSACSRNLPGKTYDIRLLLETLVDVYSDGNWDNVNIRVPEHPYCTHVVKPL